MFLKDRLLCLFHLWKKDCFRKVSRHCWVAFQIHFSHRDFTLIQLFYAKWFLHFLTQTYFRWVSNTLRGIFQRKNECDFQDSNSEPCEQKASMLPQDHSYSWTWRIIWLCYSKMAASSSPKLFLSFSLQTLAVDRSALLCQWDA